MVRWHTELLRSSRTATAPGCLPATTTSVAASPSTTVCSSSTVRPLSVQIPSTALPPSSCRRVAQSRSAARSRRAFRRRSTASRRSRLEQSHSQRIARNPSTSTVVPVEHNSRRLTSVPMEMRPTRERSTHSAASTASVAAGACSRCQAVDSPDRVRSSSAAADQCRLLVHSTWPTPVRASTRTQI